jgi:O-antigen ligase
MAEIINRKFYLILGFIFLAELFSIFSFLFPKFQIFVFSTIILLTLILSLQKLEYGLYVLLIELIIGSKGYLFFFENDGLVLSIRISLWLIIMSVWAGQLLYNRLKGLKDINKFPYFIYFSVLFIFILWGLINGKLNNNTINNIFFDFNGWLYFALIFPFYSIFKYNKSFKDLFQVFLAAISWLCTKTLLLLYFFSHDILGVNEFLYFWVRTTGVGEITKMSGDFYRIFFQSHIFVLVGFFLFLSLLVWYINKNKISLNQDFLLLFSGLTFSLVINIISLSRSNWVGLLAGAIIIFVIILLKLKKKTLFKIIGISLISIIISLGIIFIIVKFPFPQSTSNFDPELVKNRAGQISGEAGVSSRWALLPNLWKKIGQAPIMGQGFGTTVSYISSDPRVLESSPNGEYTTYAFEWGWLDIWLKLGLFGLTAYLSLLFLFIIHGFQNSRMSTIYNSIYFGFTIGLISITIVSFFSPYMNHPLGIGYLLIISVLLGNRKAEKTHI